MSDFELNEKLSISQDVVNCSYEFMDFLKDITNNYSISKTFSYMFFGLKFDVQFERRFNVMNPQFAITNISRKNLELYYDNDDFENFLNTVTHECLHIYQYFKNYQLYQNDMLYKRTINLLKKSNVDKNISDIDILFINALYASFDFEQDAMVHGLYTYLKAKHPINALMVYKDTDEYAYLRDMKNALMLIDNESDIFKEDLFGIDVNKYYHLIKRQFNRFHTKIDKMIQFIADNEEMNEGLIHIRHN